LGRRDVDLYDVNLARTFVIVGLAASAVAGCGGGHAITPGQGQAALACRSTGTTAALAATRAAAVNPAFAPLAADENALATSQAPQVADISDGDPTDDADVGAVAAGVGLGSPAQQKVIADCMNLGLPVAKR
jgi:hypothetical protein